MKMHTFTNHWASASQASSFQSTLSNGSIRKPQQARSTSYTLWHPWQQLQAIMLSLFYSGYMFLVTHSQTTPLGSSLSGSTTLHWNETLESDDGQFTVGFYHNEMVPSNAGYNLAIWYTKVPIVTPLWMPEISNGLSNQATLSLSKEGRLQVQDGISAGSNFVWASPTTSLNGTTATILKTGNLVLLNNEKNIVWQSFDNPTNTLLPNQSYLTSNKVSIYSWKDESNYNKGQYLLSWSSLGQLGLSYKSPYFANSIPYWIYNLSITTNIDVTGVVLTSMGEFQGTISSNKYTIIGKSNITESKYLLRRITLDIDGNLRMYSWQPEVSKNWNVDWEAIIQTCNIYGLCGPYAICVDGKCQCPTGFNFDSTTNKKKSCVRIKNPSFCNQKNITDDFHLFPGDYPYGYDMAYYPNVSIEYCQNACLNSCNCQCATISYPSFANGTIRCWLKSSTLINGRFASDRNSYLRMAPHSNFKDETEKLSYTSACLIIYIVGPFMLILGLMSLVLSWPYIAKWMKIYQLYSLEKKWRISQEAIVRFTYSEVQLITQNFIEKIGQGRYGIVYKGEIGHDDSKVYVAVKQLDKLDQDVKSFISEIDFMKGISHIYLIRLLGYCVDKHHTVLIYEYMENLSLDILLFRPNKSMPILEWRSRFNIVIQTAKGLAYLHDDISSKCIIHGDVKPENILIDSTYLSKLSDFGLSCISNCTQSFKMATQIRGNCEYVAPEWTSSQASITLKSDVYSFGMVLFEIISGHRNSNLSSLNLNEVKTHDSNFPMWAYSKLYESNFNILQVLDPSLTGIAEHREVERTLNVAFWCINNNHQLRPSMSEVVQMLEGHVPIALPVPQPNFKNKSL